MRNIFKNLKLKRRMYAALAGMGVFGNPGKELKIIGVTGTNGKTTVATLLYRVATALGHKSGLIGTVENIVGVEKRPMTHTTPDPLNLNKLLKDMISAGCQYVFMEVSSHALDQNRVAGIHFTGGIFTNLTHDHLDYHGNLENYFQAKKKFFDKLPASSFALSNADDSHGRGILEHTKGNKHFYGLENATDVEFYGKILTIDFSGLELSFNAEIIKSKLLGKFNAYNLLTAWSACKLLGFDMTQVNKILENVKPPRGRFEHFKTPSDALVIVDYAHTADALEKVITASREILAPGGNPPKAGKLIVLAGAGGDRDPLKRPKMGQAVALLADVPIFT